MIQIISLIWETVTLSLSWLPPFCQSFLITAGSALGIIALIVLVVKVSTIIK